MSSLGPGRPFPGLRPYAAADHAWFFGREEQSLALYRLIDRGRLVAVVGSSGSGKSSVVRAGLLPLLDEETHSEGGRLWRWWEMRPGDAPIARLAETLAGVLSAAADETAGAILAARRERLDFLLRKSSFGLVDALREIAIAAGTTPLILVDQFEELFRFADLPGTEAARAGRREEAAAFVQLLLEASRAPELPARIVLTMRSDYLGDCARFHGLPEAATASQFLVPSLTRDQRAEAILGPIRQAEGDIAEDLVERLLNDSSEELDQLPVLQHALMRTWNHVGTRSGRRLTLDDYQAVGGTARAISEHADALLEEPSLHGRGLAVEQVFRALAEIDRQGRGIRRPLSFAQLVAETGMPEGDVRAVVDRFRRDDCSFLVPPFDANHPLANKDVIDIGHEALIRRWTRMSRMELGVRSGWLWEEAADGRTYRGLLTIVDGAGPALPTTGGAGRSDRTLIKRWARIGREVASQCVAWLWKQATNWRLARALLTIVDYLGLRAPTLPSGQLRSRLRWWQQRPRTVAWAERYEGRLAEVERLFADSRRRSWLAGGALILVCVTLAGSAIAVIYSWRQAEQRADESTAALIWSRLDFERTNDPKSPATVRALWDLADGTTGVRDAFLYQLALNRYQVDTLASAPTAIMRAFGVHPKPGDTERLLAPVLTAIGQNTDPVQLQALAQAAQTLGSSLTREQVQRAVELAIKSIQTTKDPNQLLSLMQAIQFFQLDSSQTKKIVQYVLDVIPNIKDTAQLLRLGQTIQDLSPSAYQLQPALDSVLKSISDNFEDPDQLLKLTQTVQTFKAQSEQLQQCILYIIEIIKGNKNRKELRILTKSLENLNPNPQQAQVVVNYLLSMLNEKNTINQTKELIQALKIISPIAGKSIGRVDYDVIVRLIGQTDDDQDQLNSLLDSAASLTGMLSEKDAAQYFNNTLSYITKIETGHNLWALGKVAELIGPRLSQNFRNDVADDILTYIKRTSHPYQIRALARALHAVVPQADSQQSSEALSQITKISDEKLFLDPWKLQAIILAVEILSCPQNSCPDASSSVEAWANSNLHDLIGILPNPADGGQRQARIETILSLLRMLPPQESRLGGEQLVSFILKSSNPGTLDSLNDVLQKIAITSEQAKTALHAIVQAVATADNPDRFTKLRDCAQILFTKLRSSDQAQAALDDVLEATKLVNHTDGDNQHSMLKILADAVQVLGPTLTAQQKAEAIEAVRNQLTQVDSPEIATGLASAIVANIPFDQTKPELYVVDIISLLKWPTTAGPATEILLEVLHKQVPDAPGKVAGLDATVAWVAKTYPEIDLDSPPTYPAAARTAGGR